MAFIRHFLIAVQFFTRIPVTGRLADWVGFSPAMLRASAAHFPGVGWVVGLPTALVFAAPGNNTSTNTPDQKAAHARYSHITRI